MVAVEEIVAEFRAQHGTVTSIERLKGLPLVLITHTGAKSGKTYTTPLGVLDSEVGLVIAATANASPTHPAWYHNLVADPNVIVEYKDDRYPAVCRFTEGEERQRLFDQMARQIDVFEDYERRTEREIPVIVLERAD